MIDASRRCKGFTLIEIIGVIAIIAILASVIAPNLAREITRTQAQAEQKELETIADALVRVMQDSRTIPGMTIGQWDVAVAGQLDVPTTKISQSRGSGGRRLILDPASTQAVPYNQVTLFSTGVNPAGTLPTVAPSSMRLLLLGDLTNPVPNTALTVAQFDAVWNQTGTIPAGFVEGNTFVVSRRNFAQQFHMITLSTSAAEPACDAALWALDNATPKVIPASASLSVALIEGTRIQLFRRDTPLSTPTPLGVLVVRGSLGLNFFSCRWSW